MAQRLSTAVPGGGDVAGGTSVPGTGGGLLPSAVASAPAGAGTGGAAGSSGSTPATGAAPTTGAPGAVGRVVLGAYQDWWAAQVAAYSGADPNGAQVKAYSNGTALGNILLSLHSLHAAKLVMTGEPVLSPVVRSLDLNGSSQSAVIEDCVDVSGWHQSDPSSGALKDPPQRLTRYPAQAVLRLDGSIWMVFEFTREAGRTC
ncbi:hypothetical protein OG455_06875 [Kitasatospora sp. NBC_01287]|uniref:hypothetical protein n=1 Tax=Kitasatospora sp. NBC_01287 TaxID=2903573 RepID=UPI002257A72E|nr:hypothetical protein [Kitasatospora sp. NBC_01287]MCX4745247.1 hypothetical protein [Kitasatospora sp. NBC_01287]